MGAVVSDIERDRIIRDVIAKAFQLNMITLGDAERLYDAFGVTP